MDFAPRDGELVELRGRLGVFRARGDLQLMIESMERAGQGALFEQFLRFKAKLGAQDLFDPALKRELPAQPRAIGVVEEHGPVDNFVCLVKPVGDARQIAANAGISAPKTQRSV
jgi:exodeoxyribonuclease VII large subunit